MLELDIELCRGRLDLRVSCTLTRSTTGLFGPSGAGKTTLLHCIAGLIKPDSGSIVLGGRTLFDSRHGIDMPPHRRHVGMVFQEGRLFPHLSVKGNLEFGLRHSRGYGKLTMRQMVDFMELGPLLQDSPRRLSGGQQQRVALGRAMLSGPQLLLLDEPMASLDAALKREILPFIRRVQLEADIPILIVSHDAQEILCLTDRFLLMESGKIAAAGTHDQLLRDASAHHMLTPVNEQLGVRLCS